MLLRMRVNFTSGRNADPFAFCFRFQSLLSFIYAGTCLFSAWSSSHWDVRMKLEPLGRAFSLHGAQATGTPFLFMELEPLGRAFSLHGAQATGTCLFSEWSSSHWDVPFLCMELEPLGRAFSLHGAWAAGTCLFSAWSLSRWDVPFLCMELKPLGRAFSLHGAWAAGTCLFSAWSSSHWDVSFLCMKLEPLGRAFSLHGAQAAGTCLFSAWSSSHWDVSFLCMKLKPLGRAFSLHGAQATEMCLFALATGMCLFSASSHWDVPFVCMELEPLGRAFSPRCPLQRSRASRGVPRTYKKSGKSRGTWRSFRLVTEVWSWPQKSYFWPTRHWAQGSYQQYQALCCYKQHRVFVLDVGNILKQFQAEGEPWRQFFSHAQGHRQSLERTPFETGYHRGGRSRREWRQSTQRAWRNSRLRNACFKCHRFYFTMHSCGFELPNNTQREVAWSISHMGAWLNSLLFLYSGLHISLPTLCPTGFVQIIVEQH